MKPNLHTIATRVSSKIQRDGFCTFPQIICMVHKSRTFSNITIKSDLQNYAKSNILFKSNLPLKSFRTFSEERIEENSTKENEEENDDDEQLSPKDNSISQPKVTTIGRARIDELNIAEVEVDKELQVLLNRLETEEYNSDEKHPDKVVLKTLFDLMDQNEVNEVIIWLLRIESDFPHLLNVAINPALKFLSRTNRNDFLGILDRYLFKEGNFLNATSFHIAMAHHSRRGELEQMDALFTRIRDRNIKPTPVTYAIRIEGYGRAGYLQTAIKVFDEMIEDEVVPDEETMMTLIKVVGHYNRVELVNKYLNILINDMHIIPKKDSFEILINIFGRHNQILDMLRVFDKMYNLKVLPTGIAYLTALKYIQMNSDVSTTEIDFWVRRIGTRVERNSPPSKFEHKQLRIIWWKMKARLSYFDFVSHKLVLNSAQHPRPPPPYPHLELPPLKPHKLDKQQKFERKLANIKRKEAMPRHIVLPKPGMTPTQKMLKQQIERKTKRETKKTRRQQVKHILMEKSAKLKALKKRHKELKDEVTAASNALNISPYKANLQKDIES